MTTNRPLAIGVVTDEVSRLLPEALDLARSWGLSRFELREGRERRFPYFTPDERAAVEAALRDGAQVTAVSPGIFKGHADDEARLRRELDEVLPLAIERAVQFACPLVIVFGFERCEGEPEANRARAMKAWEKAAQQAADAGLRIAIENEPNFWIDRPEPSVKLLSEIGHPALWLNWDAANVHWGGRRPIAADVETVRPYLANVHVKDFSPDQPEAPWVPIGDGTTPWAELFGAIARQTDLAHVTLETHCEPLEENSRRSLEAMRRLLGSAA